MKLLENNKQLGSEHRQKIKLVRNVHVFFFSFQVLFNFESPSPESVKRGGSCVRRCLVQLVRHLASPASPASVQHLAPPASFPYFQPRLFQNLHFSLSFS